MQDSTRRLLEFLDNSGTGDGKLDRIRLLIEEEPDIGPSGLIERMTEVGLSAGTITKARQWCDDPSLVLPPRVKTSTMHKLAEAAASHNRREEVSYVEPTRSRS